MFRNAVYKDICDHLKKVDKYGPAEGAELLISTLRGLKKDYLKYMFFYAGENSQLVEIADNEKVKIPLVDDGQWMKLPYSKTALMYEYKTTDGNTLLKEIVFCQVLESDLWMSFSLRTSTNYSGFMLSPYWYLYSIGKDPKKNSNLNAFLDKLFASSPIKLRRRDAANGVAIGIDPFCFSEDDIEESFYRVGFTLSLFVKLLNCKNISSSKVEPDAKLKKRALKRGKQDVYSYHILELTPFNKNSNSGEEGGSSGIKKRVHLCRGHFREYTEEKPLFGKYSGLFWVESHVRGRENVGFVDKDYHIDLGQKK